MKDTPETESPVQPPQRLAPVLGLRGALSIVIGAVIGSGIFFVPKTVAHATEGYLGLVLLLWIVCGVVNLCGALALAELSAMLPHAGGTYLFLREAYGRLWAFLWGWAELWIMRSGAIAALAVALATTLLDLAMQTGWSPSLTERHWLIALLAAGCIVLLAAVNAVGTHWGGRVQDVTTLLKVIAVALLALLPFCLRGSEADLHLQIWPSSHGWVFSIGAALAAVMWTYDGWGMVTVVAEEIRNPQRNIPLALTGGVGLLIILYVGATLGFHFTLPWEVIASADNPALTATQAALGSGGGTILLVMLVVSLAGALNSNVLVGPRVQFALGRDFSRLGLFRHIDPRFGTPALAILILCGWSILLIVVGALTTDPTDPQSRNIFEVLITYVVFGGSVFYLSAVAAVFILRKQQPNLPRPYRAWGYPLTPAVFILFYLYLLYAMLLDTWTESLAGLVLIALGIPVYWLLCRPARAT